MKELLNNIKHQLSKHFNYTIEIKKTEQIFGGGINQTFHLKTNIGSFFLKLNNGSLKDMFEKEFQGLELLYQTNSIKIPKPILYGITDDQIFLITEFIQRENPSKNFWQTFARQLAELHQNTSQQFGLKTDNYIGSLHQQNNFCNSWADFYATQRILPLAQKAFDQQKFNQSEIKNIEQLCIGFAEIFPEEKPSLIHGDLWSGNFIYNENGEPVIFDPAVYFGNREMDVAMSLLFGGFDNSFYKFYNEFFPLQPSWKERVQICQLYPLLVHLILFGGNYHSRVSGIIKKYS